MIYIPKDIIEFDVNSVDKIVEEKIVKKNLQVKHLYNYVFGTHAGSPTQQLLVVDYLTNIPYHLGRNSLSFDLISEKDFKKLKSCGSLTSNNMQIGYKMIPTYTKEEILSNIDWEQFVYDVVNDGCIKDEIITNLTIPLYIPVPLDMQNYNCHMTILTPTKVGKTEIALSVGSVPIQTCSVPGLLGSQSRDRGKINGLLEGRGIALIDEITTDSSYNITFGGQLLDYMEQGSVMRAIEFNPECRGSKTLIFTGNTDKGPSESLKYATSRICGDYYMERMGSRMGFILIAMDGEMKIVEHENAYTRERRNANIALINNCLHYFNSDIIFKYFKHIWLVRDEPFIAWLKELRKYIVNDNVASYIGGYSVGYPDIRIRNLAFRSAIVMSIPHILRCDDISRMSDEDKKVIGESLSKYTQYFYEKYKSYVSKSITKLYDYRMDEAYKLWKLNIHQYDIAKYSGVSQSTISIWSKRWGGRNERDVLHYEKVFGTPTPEKHVTYGRKQDDSKQVDDDKKDVAGIEIVEVVTIPDIIEINPNDKKGKKDKDSVVPV